MDDQQQRELARGLRQGRVEAWQTLYEAYARRIWHSVARLMGPRSADVADVVQETFLAAARSARRYDPAQGSLFGWLSGIARNHVALYYRKRQRQDRIKRAAEWLADGNHHVIRWLENREEAPPEALAAAELATLVRATLSGLSDDYETLLTEKYFDGATVQQIAGRENCSHSAARSRLARARRAFRLAFMKTCSLSTDSRASEHDES